MKTIGVVGSRRRDTEPDYRLLVAKLLDLKNRFDGEEVRYVSGGCPSGGDKFAERFARHQGATITIHHANWSGPLKLMAGKARNTKIAQDCDILVALPAYDRSGGTEDSIAKATALGKEVILI